MKIQIDIPDDLLKKIGAIKKAKQKYKAECEECCDCNTKPKWKTIPNDIKLQYIESVLKTELTELAERSPSSVTGCKYTEGVLLYVE